MQIDTKLLRTENIVFIYPNSMCWMQDAFILRMFHKYY